MKSLDWPGRFANIGWWPIGLPLFPDFYKRIILANFFFMKQSRVIKCPSCKKAGFWFDGEFGPFCSKRCRLIDLGKWLGEENRISEPLKPGHFESYENLANTERLDQPEE
jgi:endogenous inhibitor of DNA gyrase (YacG/DUF329 family)